MKDSYINAYNALISVVNCFQKLLSSWWRTAWTSNKSLFFLLWIAFKNYYLRDEGQQYLSVGCAVHSCELLSKIIIFVMKDSVSVNSKHQWCVVNCFQKLLSSWWRTAILKSLLSSKLLWIAFKNYYLRDEGQQSNHIIDNRLSCELLSKIIIFVMKDSFL